MAYAKARDTGRFSGHRCIPQIFKARIKVRGYMGNGWEFNTDVFLKFLEQGLKSEATWGMGGSLTRVGRASS